ncbi:MAG: hypothetical protein AAB401_22145 [Acidobacteriota bacterium]
MRTGHDNGSGTFPESTTIRQISFCTTPVATITAPTAVCVTSTGNTASVPDAGVGATYTWTITNGTITAGAGTRSIIWTAAATGPVSLGVTVSVGAGCDASSSTQVTVNPLPTAAAGVDAIACQSVTGPTAFNLSGAVANGTASWSFVSSTGTITSGGVSFGNAGSAATSVSIAAGQVGTVTLRLTSTSNTTPACGTATDDVVLTVNNNPNITITVTVPTLLCANSTGHTASVPDAGAGATYVWTIDNGGAITAGQGTRQIIWTAGNAGTTTIGVTVTTAANCTLQGSQQVTVVNCSDLTFSGAPGSGIPGKAFEGDACNGATAAYVLTVRNTGPFAAAPGVVLTDVLPTGITPIAASGTGWNCAINTQTVTCTSTAPIAVNAISQVRITVGIGYNISGAVTNTATVAYPNDPNGANNSASVTINITNGLAAPGLPFAGNASSVLIYPVYTSGATSGNTQNTRINLTNINSQKNACAHLFFVAEGCSVADSYVCLTPNQTTSFLASDLDPGTSGYLVAVAVDCETGCPINFNFLIGDEYVKFASGHAANLKADGIAALPALPVCGNTSVTATLNFDGVNYTRAAATLALSNVGSRADGNDTLLILNRIGGNLGIGAATLGTLFGILYDDAENALSFSISGLCQLRSSLSNNFPRTTPRFETFIPAGRTGWLKMNNQTGAIGMTGAAINFNANAASSAGAFNQGHNLHALTLSSGQSYIIPVFPPSC